MGGGGGVLEFDLDSWDETTQRYKRFYVLDLSLDYNYILLRNGPDGRMYMSCVAAGTGGDPDNCTRCKRFLGVINKPDEFGSAAEIFGDTIFLGDNWVFYDLPYYFPGYLYVDVKAKASALSLCAGDTLFLFAASKPGASYSWSGPNGYSSVEQNPVIPNSSVAHSGKYKVKVKLKGLSGWDEIYVKVNPQFSVSILGTTTFCDGDSVILIAKPFGAVTKYKWSTGDSTYSIKVKKAGEYSVEIENANGCKAKGTIQITTLPLPQVSISQLKPLCKGGTTMFRVITDDKNNKISWSTGETTDTITISEEKKYSLIVTSQDGCHSSVEFNVKAVQLPTVNITGKTNICDGAPAELSTDIPFSAYKWSTGETTRNIIVTKTGSYSVDVTDSNGCIGNGVVEVKVAKGIGVRVLGIGFICKGESVKLSADADFAAYLWSSGETSKSIFVNKAGKYFLTVTDTNNCTSSDSITIIEKLVRLDGIKDLSFGRVSVDETKQLFLNVKNTGTEDIEISIIKTYTQYYKATIDKQILKPNEFCQLTVLFSPSEPKVYNDSLILEIEKPCFTRYSANLRGAGTADILAWLPELTGEVGQLNLEVPLYAKITNTRQLNLNRDFHAEVRYDYTALKPEQVQPNGVTNLGVLGKENGMEFNGTNVFTNSEQKIGSFFGDVMLALQDTTPLLLKKFEIQDTLLNIKIIDGSFILQPVCKTSLRRITTFEKVKMSVQPNPAGDAAEVRITGSEQGAFSLNIYTIEGIKIGTYEFTNEQNKIFEKKFQINTEKYSSGIYFIVLNKPMGVERERLNVVR
ncbi:MAG: hypothetical protein HW421_1846 [Ignavibacteria bacterium]|nr:hypothetical protein [Ignavibacteria bacterium]